MTWRRFRTLTAGLSLTSRWVNELRLDAGRPREITDPAAAERYFEAIR